MDELEATIQAAEEYYCDDDVSLSYAGQPEPDFEESEPEPVDDGKREEVVTTKPQQLQIDYKRFARPVGAKQCSYVDFFSPTPSQRGNELALTLPGGKRQFFGRREVKVCDSAVVTNSAFFQVDPARFREIEETATQSAQVFAQTSPSTSPETKILRDFAGKEASLATKHSPQRFIELLSHEKQNREALKWLKRLQSSAESSQKILLLWGPPGSGKTSLAHALARQCNYRAVEINASDERNVAILDERIKAATETTPVLDSEHKSNLLVLDEIDGATDGVEVLVRYAKDSTKHKPIICTCNDAYLPQLTALRKVSLVMNIPLPSHSAISKRLKEICEYEGISVQPGVLEKLAKDLGFDIRACLNSIDFWVRQRASLQTRDESISLATLNKIPLGSKDTSTDIWVTWKKVLNTSRDDRVLLPLVLNVGSDLTLLADGLHENYLRKPYVDPSFRRTSAAADWLCLTQMFQDFQFQEMDFTFYSYAATSLVGLAFSIAGGSLRKLVFPTQASILRNTQHQNMTMLHECFSASEHCRMTRKESALAISNIVLALIPCVRDIAYQAMSGHEKEQVSRFVQLMNELHLTMKEDLERVGVVPCFRLEPPIESLCSQAKLSSSLARAAQAVMQSYKQELCAVPKLKRSKLEAEHQPSACEKHVTDMFGFKVAKVASFATQQPAEFSFKFNEGFTDAVRRQVSFSEL